MKPARIVNRGRIAPSSPKPVIDSGRNSWSTASLVSTIDTKSPEPNIAEQVTQKLQETVPITSTKKKMIIGLIIAAVVLGICGAALGGALPSALNKSPLQTTSTIEATTMLPTTITTATTITTTSATTTSATTTTTTTDK